MNTAGLIRRVQQLFGDRDSIVIDTTMLVDWINDGQLEIARQTQYRTATANFPANEFINGKAIADMVVLRRCYYDSKPLNLVQKELVDNHRLQNPVDLIPDSYYEDGNLIFLYPAPTASDATEVTVTYVDTPTDLASQASALDLPIKYHVDLLHYVLAQAHESNENYRAAELYLAKFNSGIAQRKYEGTSQDDSFHTVVPDEMDTDLWYDRSL